MEKLDPKVDDGHQHCFRGLEFKTRNGSREKQWNVMESCMVVIDEQLRHQQLQFATSGVSVVKSAAAPCSSSSTDVAAMTSYHQQQQQQKQLQQQQLIAQADDIARAYKACTESSQKAAFERGLWDHHAALACNANIKQLDGEQEEENKDEDDTVTTAEDYSFSSTVLTVTRIDDVIMHDRNQTTIWKIPSEHLLDDQLFFVFVVRLQSIRNNFATIKYFKNTVLFFQMILVFHG